LAGVSVIRIFFQPNVRIDSAIAQVTAVSQTILRRMPPGAQPPFIIRYNASSVPILQLALGSKTLTDVLEQEGRALADELGDQAIWKATASSEKSL